MPRDDQRRLIERARRGDKAALSELYRRHVDAIYRYVLARVRDPVVAEDLTAEVFLKMLEGLPGYRYTGAPLEAWLYRIAHARTVDYWRRIGRRQDVELPDTLAANEGNPETSAHARIEWDRLTAALAHLTESQQQVILLRFIEGLSLAHTAAVMGKSVGAVKVLQHRALAKLARLLGLGNWGACSVQGGWLE